MKLYLKNDDLFALVFYVQRRKSFFIETLIYPYYSYLKDKISTTE